MMQTVKVYTEKWCKQKKVFTETVTEGLYTDLRTNTLHCGGKRPWAVKLMHMGWIVPSLFQTVSKQSSTSCRQGEHLKKQCNMPSMS